MINEQINGYVLLQPLSNNSSGNGKWGFARKNGVDVFIKEFLSPVYPLDRSMFSDALFEKKKNECAVFINKKMRLYHALHKCKGDGLVTILEYFRFGSKFYMTTKRIYAIPISPEKLYRMPVQLKLKLMRELSSSLAELHSYGIIHADIKLDNILMTPSPKGGYSAKIIDFDSSFFHDDIPESDSIQGDLIFLAPETFRYMDGQKNNITTKIDVFAMGIIFYQILQGTMPVFTGPQDGSYPFEAVIDGRRLLFRDKSIPLEIAKMIENMLLDNPKKRLSMSKVLKILNKYY